MGFKENGFSWKSEMKIYVNENVNKLEDKSIVIYKCWMDFMEIK